MITTHLLYLHGFRSSPSSFKAVRVRQWLAEHAPNVHWWCPQLPPSPAAALALVQRGTAAWPCETSAVLGSSLGGLYATCVANTRGWACGLMNPAVFAARDLGRYVGVQRAHHDPSESFFFHERYADELRLIETRAAGLRHPQRCFALIAKGDGVLSWREMAARCAGAHIRLIDGSDHALSDFDVHLPHLMNFLNPCD